MRLFHIVVVLALAVLPACESSPSHEAKPGERASLLPGEFDPDMFDHLVGSRWELVSVEGRMVGPSAGTRAPGISIGRNGNVSGFAGVNSFSGRTDPRELAKGRVDLGDVMSTLIGGPPEVMREESDYLSALHRARTYSVSGDTLTLLGEDERPLLVFRRG